MPMIMNVAGHSSMEPDENDLLAQTLPGWEKSQSE